jgi:hypothetical protein
MSSQDSFPGEVPAEIRSTTRQGPLLLVMLAALVLIILQIPILLISRSDFLPSILSLPATILFLFATFKIMSVQSKTGPLRAWFSPRSERVWVKVDEDDLVVRLAGKREAYRPSKLEWVNDASFNVWEGEISFQLAFQNPSDASKVAEIIKGKFLGFSKDTSSAK